jgi:hypothetical protein
VPANKLDALLAIQDAVPAHGKFAKSACGLLTNDSSPSKEKPRLRMIRLIPAEILCRRLRLFIRAVFWDTASALNFERRGSSCDSGVQTAVGCIDVPDAWTGAGGQVVPIINFDDLVSFTHHYSSSSIWSCCSLAPSSLTDSSDNHSSKLSGNILRQPKCLGVVAHSAVVGFQPTNDPWLQLAPALDCRSAVLQCCNLSAMGRPKARWA